MGHGRDRSPKARTEKATERSSEEIRPDWEVVFDTSFERDLGRLDYSIAQRIVKKARTLEQNPFPFGCEKLTGYDQYRIRVGGYRIAYTVNRPRRIVNLSTVDNRDTVYKSIKRRR